MSATAAKAAPTPALIVLHQSILQRDFATSKAVANPVISFRCANFDFCNAALSSIKITFL